MASTQKASDQLGQEIRVKPKANLDVNRYVLLMESSVKVIRKYHFFPLILFLSLFVDGQISFLISRFSPNSFEPTSFFISIWFYVIESLFL